MSLSGKETPPMQQHDRMSPVPLNSEDSPVPVAMDVENTRPSQDAEAQARAFQAIHILSIAQLVFMALTTKYWSLALRYLVWERNAIEDGRKTWMFECLFLAAGHVGALFYAISASVGIWIGATWQKSRQDPSVLTNEITRIRRLSVFMAAFDLPAAFIVLLLAMLWAWGTAAVTGLLLLVHCFLSMMVHQAVGVAAKKVDKEPVSGELEFSIHSSLIFASSIGHIVAATIGIWVVGSGIDWSRGRDGFTGACYIAGLLAAIASGALATNVSSQHLFEKREGLNKTGARAAFIINAFNVILGGVVATSLRGWRSLPDTLSVIPFLAYTMVMLGRLHYLGLVYEQQTNQTRQPGSTATSASVSAYVQRAQNNMEEYV